MILSLTILGIPFSKQSFRFTKLGRRYQTKKVKDGESDIRQQVISQLPKGFVPFTGPVKVEFLQFTFPYLSATSKAKRAEDSLIFKTTKPDLTDNLMKGLFDAMQGIVYINDSQVCEIKETSKVYGETPSIMLILEGE